MGRPLISWNGYSIGRLTVLETYRKNGRTFVKCQCECGNTTDVRLDSIKDTGETRSCGCLSKEIKDGVTRINVKHGMSESHIYRIWNGMKSRCYQKTTQAYKKYGAKGIVVCDDWHSFEPFYKWSLENGYKEGYSIDRIDFNGNYEPSNCRWIPLEEQQLNKRNSIKTEVRGELLNLSVISRKYKIPLTTINRRYKQGKRGEELIEPTNPMYNRYKNKK